MAQLGASRGQLPVCVVVGRPRKGLGCALWAWDALNFPGQDEIRQLWGGTHGSTSLRADEPHILSTTPGPNKFRQHNAVITHLMLIVWPGTACNNVLSSVMTRLLLNVCAVAGLCLR